LLVVAVLQLKLLLVEIDAAPVELAMDFAIADDFCIDSVMMRFSTTIKEEEAGEQQQQPKN
jgi:hypothetical protein